MNNLERQVYNGQHGLKPTIVGGRGYEMQGRVNQEMESISWKYGGIHYFFYSSFVSSPRGVVLHQLFRQLTTGSRKVEMCRSKEV